MSHGRHCCKKHGCKYGDDDCPVVLGKEKQEFKQECCDFENRLLKNSLEIVLNDEYLDTHRGGEIIKVYLRNRIKELSEVTNKYWD
jgi:hypothetical protein